MSAQLSNDQMSGIFDFHSRIEDKLLHGGAIEKLPEWIVANTTLSGKPWSFKDHEFQIGIARDTAHDVTVKKCSQIGLSELQIRITLALLMVKQGMTAIYVLPHNKFAAKFCKARVDPVIEGSEKIKKLLVKAADSSEMKRIGYSTVYFGGAADESSAISIPAQLLVEDEYDFCNQTVLEVYDSRLRHAENGGFKRKFSTPTLPGYGISKEYDLSSRGRYTVRCEHCEKVAIPDFYKHVVIPGFDRHFDTFNKDDLLDTSLDIDASYIRCEHCGKSLDASLSDPSRREWVHEFPLREKRGYSVRPFDVMKYNATARVIRQVSDNLAKYANYVHGVEYKSKDTQIDIATVQKNTVLEAQGTADGFYMGVDVGKTVHITIGRREDRKFRVICFAKCRHDQSNLVEELLRMFLDFGCIRMVIDAGPDFTLCQQLIYKLGEMVNPCVYVNDNMKKAEYHETKEQQNATMVLAMRTRGLDKLVKMINDGRAEFPHCEEMTEVREHFGGMKRTSQMDANGELVNHWQKVSPDHYFHSMFYCMLACDMDGDEFDTTAVLAAPVGIMGATINLGGEESTKLNSGVGDALRQIGFRLRL